MQIKKEYPKPVRLKRVMVIVASVFFSVIIMTILFNIFHSMEKLKTAPSSNQQAKPAESFADSNDTQWYKNEQIVVPQQVAQQNQQNSLKSSQPTVMGPIKDNQETIEENQKAEEEKSQLKAYQDAMKAPISSNQITGQDDSSLQNGSSTHTDINNASDSNSSSNSLLSNQSSNNDQNKQSEKISFLKTGAYEDSDYLKSGIKAPISPYEIQAGFIIPGILLSGINSDLPGQILGQVTENVYDSVSGKYLLIPQGTRLIGTYDSQVTYGQERVLVSWRRLIMPNGQSINLEGMTGEDTSGYSGFHDQVNNHYFKIFTSVLIMSGLGAGAQLSQPQNSNNPFQAPTVGQMMAQNLGTNLSNVGISMTNKNLNIQPTLQIRQGYKFNINVNKDMVFPGVYTDD